MSPIWLSLLGALITFLLLPLVVRWFGLRIQRLVLVVTGSQDAALYLYHFVLLPGTLVHELSHWLTAKLLGVRTGKLTLMPVRQGQVARFGSVQIAASDPLRASLIGAAPLIFGSLGVLAVVRWGLGFYLDAPTPWLALAQFGQALGEALDAPLWLYLVISLANAMLPSPSDRRAWHWVGLGLLSALLGLYLVGYLGDVANVLAPRLLPVVNALTFIGLVTLICDLTIGLLLMLLELLIGGLFDRWVDVA